MVVRALLLLTLYASASVYVSATDCASLTGGKATAATCTNEQYCTQCSRAATLALQNNCFACVAYALRTGNSAEPCVNVASNAQSSADSQTKAIAATDCICRAYYFKRSLSIAQSCLSCSSNFQDVTQSQKCSCCVASATGQNGGNDCVNTGGQNTAGVTASCPISPLPDCPGATVCPNFQCVKDFNYDRNNCGKCGNVCQTGYVCKAGACVACPAGYTTCGSSNNCTDVDPNNCGYCGAPPCSNTCTAGLCSCPAGAGDLRPIQNTAGAIVRYQCVRYCNLNLDCGDERATCKPGTTYFGSKSYCDTNKSRQYSFLIAFAGILGPPCSSDADCAAGQLCSVCANGYCAQVASKDNCGLPDNV